MKTEGQGQVGETFRRGTGQQGARGGRQRSVAVKLP